MKNCRGLLPVIHLRHQGRLHAREHLPQVESIGLVIAWAKAKGIECKHRALEASEMKPIQNEINLNGVFKLIETGLDTRKYPVLVSREHHIMDGHHRWYAGGIVQEPVHCVVVEMEGRELLAGLAELNLPSSGIASAASF